MRNNGMSKIPQIKPITVTTLLVLDSLIMSDDKIVLFGNEVVVIKVGIKVVVIGEENVVNLEKTVDMDVDVTVKLGKIGGICVVVYLGETVNIGVVMYLSTKTGDCKIGGGVMDVLAGIYVNVVIKG